MYGEPALMRLIAGYSWTTWLLSSWTTKLLSLWNGWLLSFWTVLLLITLQTMIVILPNIWFSSKWHRSKHLKSEFLSSQNFNSVHIKLIFPTIKIIPNIGIFCPYPWTFRIQILSLQTLELSHYPSKDWHSDLILSNFGILAHILPNIEIYLSYTSNFGILALSFQTLKIHFQTFEFWPFPLKHSKTDLAPPNFGILAYIPPNIVFIILSFQTLE